MGCGAWRRYRTAKILVVASIICVAWSPALAGAGVTRRASVTSDGLEANAGSFLAAVSADGRFAAFTSFATNLVEADTNEASDIFVHDLTTGETQRASVGFAGEQANDRSSSVVISANGRFVAFESFATNLVASDENGVLEDVFVYDRLAGTIELISVNTDGVQGDDRSGRPSISGDGRLVAFRSAASNLVPNDTNGEIDIFVRDRQTGTTRRVSVASDGTEGTCATVGEANCGAGTVRISENSRYVVFSSRADNLVPADTNGERDVFVHDLLSGATTRVSLSSLGQEGNGRSRSPSISANGRFVAFRSRSTNLVDGDDNGERDIFVHSRGTGQTVRVSVATDGTEANGPSERAFLSGSGRFVAFTSAASNLVDDDLNGVEDIFVHDLRNAETRRVSVNRGGTGGNMSSGLGAVLDFDGRVVVFSSNADNLVPGDANGSSDVFAVQQFDLCGGRVPTVFGTNADDVRIGSERPDVISGHGGNDIIDGLGGDDLLCGGNGSDTVVGGAGDDDRCDGGRGNDTATGCEVTFRIP